jgi:MFS family permease
MRPSPFRSERGPLEPLRHRQFVVCWLGAFVSHTASWMQTLTVPFVVFQLTQSPAWLGFTTFLQQIPSVVCGPLGGVLAERYDRRRLVMGAQLVQMSIALSFWALWSRGLLTHLRMLPLLVIGGIAGAIYITAWQTLVPLLVPASSLAAAYRINSVMFTSTRGIGPMLGGVVLAVFGPGIAFLANGLSYLVPLSTVSASRPRAVERGPRSSPFREFHAGLAYALARPPIWIPILTASVVGVFGQSLNQLAAGLADKVFHVGEVRYGMLLGMFGLGASVMSLLIALIGERIPRSAIAQAGLFTYTLAMLAVGAAHSYAVGLGGFLLMGVAHVMVQVSVATSMQIHLSESFRGRVTSLYLTGILVSVPVGSLVGGLIGEWFGLQWTARVFGVMLLGYGVYVWLGLDRLQLLDGEPPPQ